MTQSTPKIRFVLTAIAAVLALSSSQLLAQAVPEATQPVTVSPVVVVPEVTPEAATPSESSATTANDPLAAEQATTKTRSGKSAATRRAATVTRSAKAVRQVARASETALVAAPAAPTAAPAERVAASPSPTVAMPTVSSPPVAALPPAQQAPAVSNNIWAIAGAAGVGILGLIAIVVVMRRRKIRRDEELTADEQYEPASDASVQTDPLFAEPAIELLPGDSVTATSVVAESAPVVTSGSAGSPSDCSGAAPGSHVEAACGGPTADNPSLSIKKRLKRARFFDQREFLVAAGEAAPMEADAGLPDAVEVPASNS